MQISKGQIIQGVSIDPLYPVKFEYSFTPKIQD